MLMENTEEEGICRVCRAEGSIDDPLYHPCLCTGSIRYVHQDCLVQWLRHSKKEYCELCKYKYSFKPIYSPDMPSRLPPKDLLCGLFMSIFTAVKSWLHYTLVAIAWLGIVPLTACRIYRCLFTSSVNSLLTLPMDLLSTKNIGHDIVHGSVVVACTMTSFICLVWLREQILNGGIPGWLNRNGAEILANQAVEEVAGPLINDDNNNLDNGGHHNEPVEDAHAHEYSDAEEESDSDSSEAIDDEIEIDVPDRVETEEEIQQQRDQAEDGNMPVQINEPGEVLNWNALEWDRAAEELTWERMLGLDGSLVFLEHVFWVVSLNTLFILIFAFCPYHLGHFIMVGLEVDHYVVASRFEGLLTTLCGYIILACIFFLCHTAMFLLKMQRSGQVLGFFYIIVKVALLVIMEMGIFPLVCGWWLDICSLQLFNVTIHDRSTNYLNAPGTSTFFHWLLGMIYVFYFASFMLLLREVLRPGALWFLRNLNDPDFNPIQEMIYLPIFRHSRRFVLSVVIFGTAILIVVYLPLQLIHHIMPASLPYRVTLQTDAPVNDLSLELVLLQVILPALLEQGRTRQWLKMAVRTLAQVVGGFLGMKSYLLGDEELHEPPPQEENPPQQVQDDNGPNHLAHQMPHNLHPLPPHHRNGRQEVHQPYVLPKYFAARVTLLLFVMSATLSLVSLAILVIPVGIGRFLFRLWLGKRSELIHDLYPTAAGLYSCWVCGQALNIMARWFPQGLKGILIEFKKLVTVIFKCFIVGVFVIGILPMVSGVLFELIIVIPLRVPLHQTPLMFIWQDWVLGILLVKLLVASILLGPQWRIRLSLEQAYHQGLQNFNLKEVYTVIIQPVLCLLLLCLTMPYVLAYAIITVFDFTSDSSILILRRIYPTIISLVALASLIIFEAKQFYRLCDHIKNERYLVGRMLINYEPAKCV